jgi:hypothetical protein
MELEMASEFGGNECIYIVVKSGQASLVLMVKFDIR